MRVLFVVVALLLPGAAVAQQSGTNPQFLQPYQANAFGPGINSDAGGAPGNVIPGNIPHALPPTPVTNHRPIVYGNANQAPGRQGAGGNDISVLPEHPTHERIDAFNASNGGNRGGYTSPDDGIDPRIEAQANKLFPRVSQEAQRSAYIARALEQTRPQEGQMELQLFVRRTNNSADER